MLYSVLIPAFNAEQTIARAVDSISVQTLCDAAEVLLYDDGSSDATFLVAEGLAQRDSRIRILRAKRNSGSSHARNRLLDEAQGAWIAFLDADDIFLPSKLELCLQAGIEHGSDLITHDLGYLKADGSVIGQISNAEFLQASLIRRELVRDLRFSETLSAGEDSQFLCRLRRKAKHIHIPRVLTGLNIRRGSLTDRFWFQKRVVELWHSTYPDNDPPDSFDGYMKFYYSLRRAEQLNHLRRWNGQRLGRLAAAAMLEGRRWTAGRYLIGSLMLNPGYLVSRARVNLGRR